jgi:hypothetical protein
LEDQPLSNEAFLQAVAAPNQGMQTCNCLCCILCA